MGIRFGGAPLSSLKPYTRPHETLPVDHQEEKSVLQMSNAGQPIDLILFLFLG